MNNLKKRMVSLALTGSFMLVAGAFSITNAQGARQRRNEPPQRGGQVESTGNIDRNKNGIDDRFETRDGRVDINQNGVADQDENNGRYDRDRGSYGNNGYDRNRGNGMNNADFQQGYRDGLNRGREDALSNRAMTPNNSSHFRSGNPSYRAGFERGFNEAYQQNRNRRW